MEVMDACDFIYVFFVAVTPIIMHHIFLRSIDLFIEPNEVYSHFPCTFITFLARQKLSSLLSVLYSHH